MLFSVTGSREVWVIECDKNYRKWEESSVSLGLLEVHVCKGLCKVSEFRIVTAYQVLQSDTFCLHSPEPEARVC